MVEKLIRHSTCSPGGFLFVQQFAVCRPNGFTHICGQLRRWYQGCSNTVMRVTRTKTLRSLSLSYQKNRRIGKLGPTNPPWGMTLTIKYYSTAVVSVIYPKKDWLGPSPPILLWYDNDTDFKVCFLMTRVSIVRWAPKQEVGVEGMHPCKSCQLICFLVHSNSIQSTHHT